MLVGWVDVDTNIHNNEEIAQTRKKEREREKKKRESKNKNIEQMV
jgi:hypothetical protein